MRIQKSNTADELYDRLYKLKSARFNASNRLNKTYILSSYATNLLSVYIIILSVFPIFDFIKCPNDITILNFATFCISIVLLAFVLLESSMQYNLKAEKFLDCAKKVDRLFKKFEFVKENTKLDDETRYRKYYKIQKKYDKIIDLYENHDSIDFLYFQSINKLKKFENSDKITVLIRSSLVYIRYNFIIYIHYYFVIYLLPILLILLILRFVNY